MPAMIGAFIYSFGPIISNDHYLVGQGARSLLLEGSIKSFNSYDGWFPPYIYLIYATMIKFFDRPLNAMAIYNYSLMVLSCLILFRLAKNMGNSTKLSLLVVALISLSRWFGMLHSWLVADPLYLLICLAIAVVLTDDIFKRSRILVLIILINLCFATRALAFVPYVSTIILMSYQVWMRKEKWHQLLLVFLLSPLSQIYWLIRNHLVDLPSIWGRVAENQAQLKYSLEPFVEGLGEVILYIGGIYFIKGLIFLMLLLLSLITLYKNSEKLTKQEQAVCAYSILFSATYICAIEASSIFFGNIASWDQRMVIPILPFMILLMITASKKIKNIRIAKIVVTAYLIVLVVDYGNWVVRQFHYNRQGELARIEKSLIIKSLKEISRVSDPLILSDAHNILYGMISPFARVQDTAFKNNFQKIAQMKKDEAMIFYWQLKPQFNYFERTPSTLSAKELGSYFNLTEINKDEFSTLYRLE